MATKQEFVEAARQLIGTPFHHAARVPGVGVDCTGMVICALEAVGIAAIAADKQGGYNTGDNIIDMEERIGRLADQVLADDITVGDCIIFRKDSMHHHMGVYTDTGMIVHAWRTSGINKVCETPIPMEWDDSFHSVWRFRDLT